MLIHTRAYQYIMTIILTIFLIRIVRMTHRKRSAWFVEG